MTQSYKDIEFSLRRSKRKTASIYIERNGKVSVLVPEELAEEKLNELLESKRKWIYTNQAEWRDLNAARIQREYVNGEGFLYLGRSYRLRLVEEQDKALMLKGGYFCLLAPSGQVGEADEAFKEFYREKGLERIVPRVDYYKEKMGVQPNSIRIIELKNRWASCSSSGNLNFHWKCMMAPPKVLDYIAVHELAHLHHQNHSKEFWNEVDKVMPDFMDRKTWLKTNGAGMSL